MRRHTIAPRRDWQAKVEALGLLWHSGDGLAYWTEDAYYTPTSLVEATVVQWHWKDDVFPASDQYNRIHEAPIERWQAIAPDLDSPRVHFAHVADSVGEDTLTTAYMMDLAREAGLDPVPLIMRDIGWADGPDGGFFDTAVAPIAALCKLYPWE